VDGEGGEVNRQRATSLSRIEEEAQRLLLQRKLALSRPHPGSGAGAERRAERKVGPGAPPEEQRREMAAIDEALGRIADGRYGTCLDCGGPLGLQRIRAIPEARYCLACSGARTTAG
jgi:RNA polymerase-binding transcription factor DksA